MSKVFGCLLALCVACAKGPPLVIVATVDGPAHYSAGLLVGDGQSHRLIPHSDRVADLMAAVHEGFLAPWSYGPSGALRGQGTLLTLARREGWSTAVFSAHEEGLQSVIAHLAACAGMARSHPPTAEGMQRMLEDLIVWAATTRAPRFAAVHLSLTSLPAGPPGAKTLVRFWSRLDRMVDEAPRGSALLAVYLPESPEAGEGPLFRVRGVRGGAPPKDLPLSVFDVAPTVALTLDLHYTPDYLGQSLAAHARGPRVEPIAWVKDGTRSVLGGRWMVTAKEPEDTLLASQIRFLDLFRGLQAASATRDAEALGMLDILPHRSEAVLQDP